MWRRGRRRLGRRWSSSTLLSHAHTRTRMHACTHARRVITRTHARAVRRRRQGSTHVSANTAGCHPNSALAHGARRTLPRPIVNGHEAVHRPRPWPWRPRVPSSCGTRRAQASHADSGRGGASVASVQTSCTRNIVTHTPGHCGQPEQALDSHAHLSGHEEELPSLLLWPAHHEAHGRPSADTNHQACAHIGVWRRKDAQAHARREMIKRAWHWRQRREQTCPVRHAC